MAVVLYLFIMKFRFRSFILFQGRQGLKIFFLFLFCKDLISFSFKLIHLGRTLLGTQILFIWEIIIQSFENFINFNYVLKDKRLLQRVLRIVWKNEILKIIVFIVLLSFSSSYKVESSPLFGIRSFLLYIDAHIIGIGVKWHVNVYSFFAKHFGFNLVWLHIMIENIIFSQ